MSSKSSNVKSPPQGVPTICTDFEEEDYSSIQWFNMSMFCVQESTTEVANYMDIQYRERSESAAISRSSFRKDLLTEFQHQRSLPTSFTIANPGHRGPLPLSKPAELQYTEAIAFEVFPLSAQAPNYSTMNATTLKSPDLPSWYQSVALRSSTDRFMCLVQSACCWVAENSKGKTTKLLVNEYQLATYA